MSYRALYRAYRPQKFSDVVGQNHIVQTLENVIKQNKIAHAYLFAGPRGTGKTSLAHIFGREINKSASNMIKDYSLDIIEIDAASNNGVAEIRTIIENARFVPNQGKYKVYIIDEVHMLTKGAWNAFLKTLEEPPNHVVFILATTQPHKIPITILSRTQRFNFKRIKNQEIEKQLTYIFEQEQIECDQTSLKFIAKLANGGLRDALSISDQAAAFGNNVITFEAISQVFGLVSIENQIKVINQIYQSNIPIIIEKINDFIDNGADLERLTFSLIEILRDLIIYRKTNDYNLVTFLTPQELDLLEIDLNFSYFLVNHLIELSNDLRLSQLPNQLFELTILKIINQYNQKDFSSKVEFKKVVEEIKVKEKPLENEIIEEIEEIEKIEKVEKIVEKPDQEDNQLHQINFDHFQLIPSPNQEDSLTIPLGKNSQNNDEHQQEKEAKDQITELFDLNPKPKTLEEEPFQATSIDFINLFLLANKDKLQKIKNRWHILNAYINNDTYSKIASNLINVKLICAGENFLLVSSEEKEIIDFINQKENQEHFLNLMKIILGHKHLVFGIARQQFDEIKNTWNIMKTEKTLPKPKPLTIKEEVIVNTKAEQLGQDIFGDLFEK